MTDLVAEAPTGARPLVLLVEDKGRRRKNWAKRLRELDAEVLEASNSDQALAHLSSSPAVDAILTDIHLAGEFSQKDGVALARLVRRQYDDTLPVIGYSGHFGSDEVTEAEKELFTKHFIKGNLSGEQQSEVRRSCIGLANEHRARRRGTAREATQQMPTAYGVQDLELKASDPDGVEAILRRAGFEIRLLTSERFAALARPVAVWLQDEEIDDDTRQFFAQVYGQPLLHACGESEDQALDYLIESMIELHQELADEADRKKVSEPYQRVWQHLESLLD